MPCIKCGDKWRLGSGKCMYTSKESCERAYRGYLFAKYNKGKKKKAKE